MKRFYIDYYDCSNYKLYYTDKYHPVTHRLKTSEFVAGITRAQARKLCIQERARLKSLPQSERNKYPDPYIYPAGVDFPNGIDKKKPRIVGYKLDKAGYPCATAKYQINEYIIEQIDALPEKPIGERE